MDMVWLVCLLFHVLLYEAVKASPFDEWTLNVYHMKADTIRSPKEDDLVIGAVIFAVSADTPLSGANTPTIRNTTFPFVRMGPARDGQMFDNPDPFGGRVMEANPGDQFVLSIYLINKGASESGGSLGDLIGDFVEAAATIAATAAGMPYLSAAVDVLVSAIEKTLKGGCDGVLLAQTHDITSNDVAGMGSAQTIQWHFKQYGGEHTGSVFDDCNPTDQHYDVDWRLTRIATADPPTVSSSVLLTTPAPTPTTVVLPTSSSASNISADSSISISTASSNPSSSLFSSLPSSGYTFDSKSVSFGTVIHASSTNSTSSNLLSSASMGLVASVSISSTSLDESTSADVVSGTPTDSTTTTTRSTSSDVAAVGSSSSLDADPVTKTTTYDDATVEVTSTDAATSEATSDDANTAFTDDEVATLHSDAAGRNLQSVATSKSSSAHTSRPSGTQMQSQSRVSSAAVPSQSSDSQKAVKSLGVTARPSDVRQPWMIIATALIILAVWQ